LKEPATEKELPALMRLRTPLTVPLALLACAALLPASAHAAFFTGESIDGPNADIRSLGDVDVARDGSGAAAYVRREGGVDHIFVSRLVSGVWQAPERVDAGLDAAGADPVVAASDGGALAIAFVSGGNLFAVVRPAGSTAFTAPALVAAGGHSPAIDMSIQGAAYLSFTVPGVSTGDVRVARLERRATTFAVLGDALDVEPAHNAGDNAAKRSHVAISADGTGVVTWGEDGGDGRTHVYARRVFDGRISTAPQDLTLNEFAGLAGASADSPDIDIEDDSSFAWVAFRQTLSDGRAHAFARRLVGSNFEAPVAIDGLGMPATSSAEAPRIRISGRGAGIATSGGATGFEAFAAIFTEDGVFEPLARLDPGNTIAPLAHSDIAETGDGIVAWQQRSGPLADRTIQARFVNNRPDSKDRAPGPPALLSDAALGPVEAGVGFDVALNRAGDAVVVYVQGGEGARRIVSAVYDRVPGTFRGFTTTKYRKYARPRLSWGTAFDLWGPITYRILVDGQQVGQTTETRAVVPVRVPDGRHLWRIVATDRRGQSVSSPSRLLRVDATKPRLSVRIGGKRKRGALVRVAASARDVLNPEGSGVRVVRISFGDGSPKLAARRAVHRYRRSGQYTVQVSATDKAGNVAVVKRRIRVRR
jgi:hypothetical protein